LLDYLRTDPTLGLEAGYAELILSTDVVETPETRGGKTGENISLWPISNSMGTPRGDQNSFALQKEWESGGYMSIDVGRECQSSQPFFFNPLRWVLIVANW
jgi:hypothetical protein